MIKLNSNIVTHISSWPHPIRPRDLDLAVTKIIDITKIKIWKSSTIKRTIFLGRKVHEQYVWIEYITPLTRGWAMAFDMLPRFDQIRLDHLQ